MPLLPANATYSRLPYGRTKRWAPDTLCTCAKVAGQCCCGRDAHAGHDMLYEAGPARHDAMAPELHADKPPHPCIVFGEGYKPTGHDRSASSTAKPTAPLPRPRSPSVSAAPRPKRRRLQRLPRASAGGYMRGADVLAAEAAHHRKCTQADLMACLSPAQLAYLEASDTSDSNDVEQGV